MMVDIKDIANAPTEMLALLRRIADACERIAEDTAQIKHRTAETAADIDKTAMHCETISELTSGILNTQTRVLKRLESLPGIPVQEKQRAS
jgi:hypothetical protein